MSPALKRCLFQMSSPGLPSRRGQPNSRFLTNPLLLLLIMNFSQASIPTHRWRFYIQATWHQDGTTRSQFMGQGDCPSTGCNRAVTLNITGFNRATSSHLCAAMLCFISDQTEESCKRWPDTYGGCPYNSCKKRFLDKPCYEKRAHTKLTIWDPWDPKWASGVDGKFYSWGFAQLPSASIRIWRTYVQVFPQIHITIQGPEKELQYQLDAVAHPKADPFSWMVLIRQGLQLLNLSKVSNISDCFLCAGLDRTPLTAIPIDLPLNTSTISQGPPSPAFEEVPLFHNSPGNFPCCYTSSGSAPCDQIIRISSPTFAPPGFFFWCNGTLTKNLSLNMPFAFCVPSTLVPKLTLYTEAELTWYVTTSLSRTRRVVFLPVVVGLSLASSLAASGLGAGGLGYAVTVTQKLEQQFREAVEASAASLASLQRQITSLAQVSLQNLQALDLLTADKGGPCLFLKEECCYYINETGLVEKNVDTLYRLGERLKQQQSNDPWPRWLNSALISWLTPILTPMLVIGFLLMIAPCILRFARKCMGEMARVTYQQMLLHPYGRLPTKLTPKPHLSAQRP
ncbi:endogenous retrovirus group FC1 Env polyprotein-like isoform X1 [Marmota marmota marmota]|uniref:endogenous retrovirus group FC1 Env polyprotein-like isoform X1 n=2 Tax=Marmota marmota marmota TaxID=9994 RepID=UPI00209374E9|nr:endogenous retrovirus group FC1 Env polyprotein-like isoform X1 [Marmota marmota marmota]XP_048668123.1 endogenous retrovirus group FC1 Env polyprotein-like isoform X1 [Marmota marmota marmota]